MAAQPGSMLDHVRNKNAPELNRKKSKETLKNQLKVPQQKTKPTLNTANVRNLRSHAQRKSSHGEDEANRAPGLFGTNASSIDESSPTEQTEHRQVRNDYQPTQEDEIEQYEEGSEDFSEEEAHEGGHREQDGPNDSMQAQGPARRFGQIHVKDDSYPDTSQVTDENQSINDRSNAHATYQNTNQTMLHHKASGTRVLPHQGKQMPTEWSQQQQQQAIRQKQPPMSQLQQEHRTVEMRGRVRTNADELIGDINDGFSFGLAKSGRPNVPTQPQAPPPNSVPPPKVQSEVMRAPSPAHHPAHQRPRVESPRPNTPTQGRQVEHRPQPRRKSGQNAPNMHVDPTQERQPSNRDDPQMRQLPMQAPIQHAEPAREPLREPELQEEPIDYDLPTLYKMEYADLKGESFDEDPNAPEIEFPDNEPTNDLPQKLEYVAKLGPQDQGNFFKSLTIDDWEEAGDWFLQRFWDLTKKLKETRREKRKAAEALEGEIQDRHNAVSKKQEMTLAAMGEMKESGGKVLQGTPKKTRKSK